MGTKGNYQLARSQRTKEERVKKEREKKATQYRLRNKNTGHPCQPATPDQTFLNLGASKSTSLCSIKLVDVGF